MSVNHAYSLRVELIILPELHELGPRPLLLLLWEPAPAGQKLSQQELQRW